MEGYEVEELDDECVNYIMVDELDLAEKEYMEDLAMRCKYYQDFLEDEGWED